MTTRRQKIEAMLADDPSDIFLRYSLALEMAQEGESDASLAVLAELSRGTPPYVPAFHMAARHLVALGRHEEARGVLREGIEEARGQGNAHAAGEMAELLASIGDEGE